MSRMKKVADPNVTATTQLALALRAPELRRRDRVITDLNRQNGELQKTSNNMGFVYAGIPFAPEEFKTVAGKNYTRSGIAWPALHPKLWDRAAEFLRELNQVETNIARACQYIGLVIASREMDVYGKRNCMPDYIANLMEEYKTIPRTESIETYLSHHPKMEQHYRKVEQTMAVLAAGQLIY